MGFCTKTDPGIGEVLGRGAFPNPRQGWALRGGTFSRVRESTQREHLRGWPPGGDGPKGGACRDTLPARSGYGRGGPYFRCRCRRRSLGRRAGSAFGAPGCVGVLAGRLPPAASPSPTEAASAGTPAPKGAAPAEAAAGTSPSEGGPPAAEAAAKAAAGAGLGPGGRRPSAPEGAAGPPAGRGPAAPKGAAEGTARPCAWTWPGAGAGRWPGSEAHTRAEAGAPGRAGGPGGPGTEDKEGTVDIAGPVPAAAVTAAAGALQSQQHHDHQHKNNNQVGQIAHGRASFPGQRYCFPYQSSRALVSSSTASS